ncbi:MAG: GNAT family N-acetyltransferase [Acidobacteriota bacterium]|nr:GNAT family N-acetyltransferase [Acidobacteriota bacterium]
MAATSALHEEVLHMEFLARAGRGFLRRYHWAWMDTDDAVALAAVDDHEVVVGFLLGALRPAGHFRSMVRRHGPQLAGALLIAAIRRPSFGRELVTTRLVRYVRGLGRMAWATANGRRRRPPGGGPVPTATQRAVGEVTHVLVRPDLQGSGAGRALLDAAAAASRAAGVEELMLVTPPELSGAVGFYEHLGWEHAGRLTSRSGEDFLRFRLPL